MSNTTKHKPAASHKLDARSVLRADTPARDPAEINHERARALSELFEMLASEDPLDQHAEAAEICRRLVGRRLEELAEELAPALHLFARIDGDHPDAFILRTAAGLLMRRQLQSEGPASRADAWAHREAVLRAVTSEIDRVLGELQAEGQLSEGEQ